jgi:putative aldouronate transport system permease protein
VVESKNLTDRIVDIVLYIILAIVAFSSILPLINTVAISLSNSSKASAGIVTFYPIGFNLESYKNLLGERNFFNAFYISVKRVVLSTSLVFIVTILAAYPLSKEKSEFKARNIYMWLFIFTMMFGAGIVPWYLTIRGLGLTGKIWALVLPGAVSQYLIILVINYFRSIPKELDECASIDGATPCRKLFQIYVPLAIPILATITLFTIVWNWNAFYDGLILMNRTEQYPLQTYIQQLVVTINPAQITDMESIRRMMAVSNRTLNAAKLVITMLPILIIYPFLQRYFITGIMLGSVKE